MGFNSHLSSLSQKLLRSKLFFGLEVLVSSVLGITLVFPILGSLLILNELLRLSYKYYLWLFYKDSIILNEDECGSNYLLTPTDGRRTILYLGEVEGPLSVESVRENYQKHVIENPVYTRLSCMLQPKCMYTCLKKCDTFDITNHIRYYPGTEERIVSENELLKNILPDLSQDMTDLEKPQWEEVIIPFYQASQLSSDKEINKNRIDSEDQKTISLRIIRIHHSYMDGASTLIMIANTMSGEGSSFPYVIDPCKPLKIPKLSMFFYKLTCIAMFSTAMLRNFLMPPFLRHNRFYIDHGCTGKRLFGWTKKIPIDYFHSIKEKSGVSMPAIVSTVLTSSIRNLELKYPHISEETDTFIKLPKVPDTYPMWIVAGMFPYKSNKPGNKHTVIETYANTSDISSCERLSIMNDDLGRLAKNPMVTVYYWFAKILGRAPSPISKILLYLASCPILLSNIPLSTRNVKLWGKECYSIMGWVPLLLRTGLGVVSVRYGDHFRYCVQVDSGCVNQEELDYFVNQIEEQVEQLIIETAQLKRKISAESSLFEHGKDNKNVKLSSTDNADNISFDYDHSDRRLANNNNTKNVDDAVDSGGGISSANYSFIFKLKDSIEHIREGIRKIKEQ